MSTQIGTVILDRDLVFINEYDYSLVYASSTPTIGGGIIVQEFEKTEKGRKVILSSSETQGLQLKSTVDDLVALSNSGANNIFTLTISSNSKTFTKTVRFMNEIEGGAIKAEPFQGRDGLHSDTIYYKVELNLMVV